MKKIITILFLFGVMLTKAQIIKTYYSIGDSLLNRTSTMNVNSNQRIHQMDKIESSCASPNGIANQISYPPSSYNQLQSNGYCNPSGSYGKNGTICWTFTPTTQNITINTGFETDCGSFSFSGSTIYTCAPLCVLQISSTTTYGFSFTAVPGQCYTWCISYTGHGSGCSFDDFCPYYAEGTVLPIELLSFTGEAISNKNILNWKTATETNNNHFSIERSIDGISYNNLINVNGSDNSTVTKSYSYTDASFTNSVNYYRLKQVDNNGAFKYFSIIAIDNITIRPTLIKRINVLGEVIQDDYDGIYIELYSDGSYIKKCCNPK